MRTKQDIMNEQIAKIETRERGGLRGYLNGLKLMLSQVSRDMEIDGMDRESEEMLIALAEHYESQIKQIEVLVALGN